MNLAALKRDAVIAAIALLVALAVGSALMLAAGRAPLHVWGRMLDGTLGHRVGIGQALFKATPLVFTGLAVAVALRVGLFNIGVEGQMVAGLVAAAVVGAALPAGTSWVIAVPACLGAAAAAGGALGALVGALKVWRGAHEVIVSIMLNAIVSGVALWLGGASLFVGESTRTATIVAGAQLPSLGIAGSSLSAAALIAVAAAVAVGLLFERTRTGAEWRAVGLAPAAARASGIGVGRAIVVAMATSGALAGLAASNFVLGQKYCYEDGLGRNVGFLGIAVALLGRGRAVGIVVAALLIGLLSQGGLTIADQVPKELMDVLVAVIILAVAAAQGARR